MTKTKWLSVLSNNPARNIGVGKPSRTHGASVSGRYYRTGTRYGLKMNIIGIVLSLIATGVRGNDFECFEFQSHSSDRTLYQIKEMGDWKKLTCRSGTIWDSEYCSCAVDPTQEEIINQEILQAHCKNFKPVLNQASKYDQLDQGTGEWLTKDCRSFDSQLIWNQTLCQCVQAMRNSNVINVDPDSTACDTMFDSCFDEDAFSANGNAKWYIEMTDKDKVQILEEADSYNGQAAFIQQAPLILPTFLDNELSDSFQIYIRFKLSESEDFTFINKYQVIFSNKCENQSATISFSYRPYDYSYRLLLKNSSQNLPLVKDFQYEAGNKFYSWKSAYIIYQNGNVQVAINGKRCLQFGFSGYPTFACALVIGGYPSADDEVNFLGYLDVMSVDRNCRSPIP